MLFAQRSSLCISDGLSLECESYTDSIGSVRIVNDRVQQLRAEGYLEAGLDSLVGHHDSLIAHIHRGERYSKMSIGKHNLPQVFLDSSAEEVGIRELTNAISKLLDQQEKIGRPFASVVILKTEVKDGLLHGDLFYDPGIEVRYDSIQVIGDCDLSKNYLAKYLNIQEGALYNELEVKRIDKLLRNLPLVKVNRSSRVYFYQGLARVVLQLDKNSTDRFDGVVGLAPNSANSSDNQLLITGEVNLELNNLFKSAKQMELHWKNYLERSQSLDMGITWPYLFNTRIGINSSFNLNKFDTLFLNLSGRLGFRYQQLGNNYIQFYYEYNGSNLITVDTNQVRSSKRIPTNNPYRIDNYGLELAQINYDYRPNPRSGYAIHTDASIGLKQIVQNTLVDAVKFDHPDFNDPISIYDTLDLRNTRAKFEFAGNFFIPVFKRATLYNRVLFGGVFASNINFNEFYTIGGFSDLQGFDENEIFGSKYLIHRLEYRYLFSKNGNIGLFFNTGFYENRIEEDVLIYDIPYGFGASANIEVGGGVLSIAYALGSQLNNPIVFNSAKIHFGLINYF